MPCCWAAELAVASSEPGALCLTSRECLTLTLYVGGVMYAGATREALSVSSNSCEKLAVDAELLVESTNRCS